MAITQSAVQIEINEEQKKRQAKNEGSPARRRGRESGKSNPLTFSMLVNFLKRLWFHRWSKIVHSIATVWPQKHYQKKMKSYRLALICRDGNLFLFSVLLGFFSRFFHFSYSIKCLCNNIKSDIVWHNWDWWVWLSHALTEIENARGFFLFFDFHSSPRIGSGSELPAR